MIKKIDKIFIFIITFLIFSNIINYLSVAKISSLTTVHLFLLTAIFTIYLIFKKPDFSFLSMRLNLWIIFYLCVILLWYILPHNEFLIHELRRKEITIINIRRQANCTQKAIDLIENGKVDIAQMVTHHFSLEQTQQAFDLVSNYKDGVMKAIITID